MSDFAPRRVGLTRLISLLAWAVLGLAGPNQAGLRAAPPFQ